MDFFEQQDVARRNSRLLTVLFLLAVLLLVTLVNVLVAVFLWWNEGYNVYSGHQMPVSWLGYLSWQRFGGVGLAICAVIAVVVLFRWLNLATGGKAVAESLGATRVLPQTDDPQERRCLNVVQEIALAANMPVPAVYVLNEERGINAFAAGTSPANAVVAVTRGTLEQLKRPELQGVIAHEFSHILNGDMNLNIRLAAMLKGITFIGDVGYFIMRGGRHGSVRRGGDGKGSGGQLMLLGLALWVLGLIGGISAGFIKAAISRQKEYLADASAVQFTRNPEGIADALKVIGGYVPGSLVHAARAAELSHFFFGQVVHGLWQLFATHPPLAERIRRIEPRWNGRYIERKPVHYQGERQATGVDSGGVGREALVTAVLAGAAAKTAIDMDADSVVNQAQSVDAQFADIGPESALPDSLTKYSDEPMGACALLFALLMQGDSKSQQRQLALIGKGGVKGQELLVYNLLPAVSGLKPRQRRPLLEICLPALKSMSEQQYRTFKDNLVQLIKADGHTSLFEWCMYQLLRHYLDPEFVKVRVSKPRYRSLDKVQYHLRVVLSVLAHEGGSRHPPGEIFRVAADELGYEELQIMPREQASVLAFSRAARHLADCYPLLKPRILKAMALAADCDGDHSAQEQELIAAIAAVMDCPVPDFYQT